MLKGVLLTVFVCGNAWAGPVTVGPIPVTGSGNDSNFFGTGGVTESFSGSNGVDSVSMSGGGSYGPDGGPGFGIANGSFLFSAGFGAHIDSMVSPYFSFFIGNGGGNLTLFDSAHNVISTADLIGYVSMSGRSYYNPAIPFMGFEETFTITSTAPLPEPGAAWLTLAGFFLLLAGVVTRRLKALHIVALR